MLFPSEVKGPSQYDQGKMFFYFWMLLSFTSYSENTARTETYSEFEALLMHDRSVCLNLLDYLIPLFM